MFRNPKHSIFMQIIVLLQQPTTHLYEIDPKLGPQDRSSESGALLLELSITFTIRQNLLYRSCDRS